MRKCTLLLIIVACCGCNTKESNAELHSYLKQIQGQYQSQDPNFVLCRMLGYMDAKYGYYNTEDILQDLENRIKKLPALPTSEKTVELLEESYRSFQLKNHPAVKTTAWVFKTTAIGMAQQQQHSGYTQDFSSTGGLTPNAYGFGVHSNQYGQPIRLRPDYGYVPGETLQIKENAYGLGVHSDQYGRPVREYPYQ
ncbi:MAG: hypothetical protein JXB18_06325 [Sedimentisphaerales bacterium]|nr:hypothetical protein [Sedimentisphaerales bacterium]